MGRKMRRPPSQPYSPCKGTPTVTTSKASEPVLDREAAPAWARAGRVDAVCRRSGLSSALRQVDKLLPSDGATWQRNVAFINEILHSHRYLLLPVPLGDGQHPLEANLAILERGGVLIESIWHSHAQVPASNNEILSVKLLA